MARIDAHTHAFPESQSQKRLALSSRDATFAEMYSDPNAKMVTMEELVRAMTQSTVNTAVVAGFAFRNERDIDEQNDHLLNQKPEVKGRVWPLATLNLAHANWKQTAQQAILAGARGFGELRPHNQRWDPLGKESRALCALSREAGVPILWHVSEPVGHLYPGKRGGISPVEFCQLAMLEPGTTMIAAHLGGGLAYYLQMPEVRTALSSSYFDTAAASLLYDEATIPRLVDLAGPERVLFASDYPLQSPRRQLERVLAAVPPEHAAAICGRNAERLFARDSYIDQDLMTSINSDDVRLFVACEVPDEVKNSIGGLIESLKSRSANDVRWIKSEGVHVTLKFLGEVPVKKLPAIKIAMQEAVVRHSPFQLEFSNIGTFGGREGLRLMWVGIAGDVLRLEALVRDVNLALAVVGFEPERRPFRPHLTLGRVRDEIGTRRRAEIEVEVGKTVVPTVTWRTSQVSLMRSRMVPGGAVYDVVATFPLRVFQPA